MVIIEHPSTNTRNNSLSPRNGWLLCLLLPLSIILPSCVLHTRLNQENRQLQNSAAPAKMVKKEMGYKAHALILPYPLQGHINPMLQFSKRLVAKGVKATLAATIFTNKSMHSDPTGSVDIETISDGFDDGGLAQAESTELYLSTLESVGAQTLADLINKLRDLGRPVNVLIYDGFLPWALDVAKRFGLLGVVFFTQPCAVNHIYYHVQRGLLPLPLAEPTVSLPGLPLLQASETPSFVSDSGSYPGFHHLVMNQFRNIDEADWVLYNNFYKLEDQVPLQQI